MTRVRSALIISPLFPFGDNAIGTGLYRRLELLVAGARDAADALRFLFFIDHGHSQYSAAEVRELEANLSGRWKASITISLCRITAPPLHPESLYTQYVTRARSYRNLPRYDRYSGREQLECLEACLLARPDFVLVQRLRCMVPLLLLSGRLRIPPVFFDLDDIEHLTHCRSIEQKPTWRSKRLGYLYVPAMMYCEFRAIRLAKLTFVCSDLDRRRLQRCLALKTIHTLPNCVATRNAHNKSKSSTILFVGNYAYSPNRIGAEYFLEHIWPVVKARIPDAVTILSGPNPQFVTHYRKPPVDVRFTGFMENVEDAYAQARLVVCPILSGGGTRIKIIEAASFGYPVVSTTIGAEGLLFQDGESIALRDEPSSFADACIRFLSDESESSRIGRAARSVVMREYNRDKITADLAGRLRRHCSVEK